jgi:hypothetical protein
LPEGISYQELMQRIPKLDDHFIELAEVVVPIMVDYENKIKTIVDAKIKHLIASGNIDQALQITKKAIEFEKNLS